MPKMLMAACEDTAFSTSPGSLTPSGCQSLGSLTLFGVPEPGLLQPHAYLQHGSQHGGHIRHPQAQQPITKSWGGQWGVMVVLGTPPTTPAPRLPPWPPPSLTQQL